MYALIILSRKAILASCILKNSIEKLERVYPEVQYVNRLTAHRWGQRVIHFYDPDGNLIEVRTPI